VQASSCGRLVFPLDVPDLGEAQSWIRRLSPHVDVFKVGLELFIAAGPAAVEAVHAAERECFLDLKLHDIPATVERAVQRACGLDVRYLTLHAVNGAEALRAAVSAADGTPTRLLAVTVLTSMDAAGLADIGLPLGPAEWVEHLTRASLAAGVRGFVSSAEECVRLRQLAGPAAILVTPGIRPAGGARGDQKRVATPADAIRNGADLLVVGRPIRDAADPERAAAAIALEIERAVHSTGKA
jgi:orotidine-5'-phosphate decarboxylase